ncbi:MAG: hypothetical protein WEB88_12510 [Gemmatimonadota bacterium]
MRIEEAVANNRRKGFELKVGKEVLFFPYARLRVQPSAQNRVEEVRPDPELGYEGFTYSLEDGSEDTVHVDAVLEYNQDPDYMRELLLHNLTVEVRKQLEESELSRREVIRRLGTSPSQFYRLIDEANRTKSFGQLFDLLHILGCEVEVKVGGRGFRSGTRRTRRKAVGG